MSNGLRETIYDRCMYKNCYNGPIHNGYTLYRFPKADDPRQEIWINNSGENK